MTRSKVLLAVLGGLTVVSVTGSALQASARTTKRTTKRATKSVVAKTTKTAKTGSGGITSFAVSPTPDKYFVLYFKPDVTASTELAVALTLGENGVVSDGRKMLNENQYRVETYSVSKPADVDGDGIDDITEMKDKAANPLNGAKPLPLETGANFIPDRATFEKMSYQGDDVARDAYLAGLEFVKFWIIDTDTSKPSVYFMNTETYKAHPVFAGDIGLGGAKRGGGLGPQPGKMRGDIVFDGSATAPDGTKGRFRFAFQPSDAYSFGEIALAYESLVTNMPSLAGKLFYYPFPQSALPLYKQEKAQYDQSRVPVLLDN